MTTDLQVVTFTSWGRPFVLRSSHFASSPQPTQAHGSLPVQVECGWDFTAVLTQNGDVFVYWPRPLVGGVGGTSGRLARQVYKRNNIFDNLRGPHKPLARAELDEENGVVKCYVWSVDCDAPPEQEHRQEQGQEQEQHEVEQEHEEEQEHGEMLVKLPDLPLYDLPDLHVPTVEGQKEEGTRIIKLAGLDCQLIGLTNKGHVIRFRGLINEEAVATNGRKWEYVSMLQSKSSSALHTLYYLRSPQSFLLA